jgi:hypothetical protein
MHPDQVINGMAATATVGRHGSSKPRSRKDTEMHLKTPIVLVVRSDAPLDEAVGGWT